MEFSLRDLIFGSQIDGGNDDFVSNEARENNDDEEDEDEDDVDVDDEENKYEFNDIGNREYTGNVINSPSEVSMGRNKRKRQKKEVSLDGSEDIGMKSNIRY